jgi:hypothetical protein
MMRRGVGVSDRSPAGCCGSEVSVRSLTRLVRAPAATWRRSDPVPSSSKSTGGPCESDDGSGVGTGADDAGAPSDRIVRPDPERVHGEGTGAGEEPAHRVDTAALPGWVTLRPATGRSRRGGDAEPGVALSGSGRGPEPPAYVKRALCATSWPSSKRPTVKPTCPAMTLSQSANVFAGSSSKVNSAY